MEKIKYYIIQEKNEARFIESVNSYLRNGYELWGDTKVFSHLNDENLFTYFQPMIKQEKINL